MYSFGEMQLEARNIKSELENQGFPQVLKYLRDRGVPEGLIEDLGIKILPAGELIQRTRGSGWPISDDRLAIVFPHFNVAGDYIEWWSARLVETGLRPVIASFANLVPHKRGKMYCPPQEAPHAYLPPILDWRGLEDGARIFIHESCIKAIASARLGMWSVGLNGVYGWTSRKHGIALVAELRDLPWRAKKLQPVIVFDSNAADNWDVQAAIAQLAAKLLEITGQRAEHLLLPRSAEGAHWGFDDYVVAHGEEASRAFLEDAEGLRTIVEVSGIEVLKLKLNSEVCLVRSMGRIAEQETGTLMPRSVFTDVNYAHYMADVDDGRVNVPRLWLQDTRRTEVEALDYSPGKGVIHDDRLNLWRGMGVEPRAGDVQVWLDLLAKNVKEPELREWFIRWLAWPLQNLGGKLNSFVHLYGPPGAGKQAILRPLMKIYGPNAITISKREIFSDFNSVYANKQFINVDEIHGGNDLTALAVTNKIKLLITDDKMTVNGKGTPEYVVPNCANLVTTSNYADSIRLDDDDRRCAVLRFGSRGAENDRLFWEFYYDWVESGGAAAVYQYLLGMEMGEFDPKGWAPMTDDKVEITRATRRVDEQWVQSLWEDPEGMISQVYKSSLCLFTTRQLAMECYRDDVGALTTSRVNSLGIKLHSAGFRKVEIKIDGRKERFWIIRKRDEEWGSETARLHLRKHGTKVAG